MAELDDLKERIEDAIHQNGRGEITGSVLQEVLLDMVDTISENADMTEVTQALQEIIEGKADKSTTYTKEEVDQAIENIDVTGQLATVATTGDYDDLSNKPTLQARVENETLIISIG